MAPARAHRHRSRLHRSSSHASHASGNEGVGAAAGRGPERGSRERGSRSSVKSMINSSVRSWMERSSGEYLQQQQHAAARARLSPSVRGGSPTDRSPRASNTNARANSGRNALGSLRPCASTPVLSGTQRRARVSEGGGVSEVARASSGTAGVAHPRARHESHDGVRGSSVARSSLGGRLVGVAAGGAAGLQSRLSGGTGSVAGGSVGCGSALTGRWLSVCEGRIARLVGQCGKFVRLLSGGA